MSIKKRNKSNVLYIPLDEIKKLDDAFLTELESVKSRLSYIKDPAIITEFHAVLLNAYKAAIEIKARECEVDYDIKITEIEERRRALKPWRRCWLWRLLLQPITNRAQDIIEERVELEADSIHSAAERANKAGRREQRQAREREKLKKTLEKADASDTNEGFDEVHAEPPATPSDVPREQESKSKPAVKQLPGQMTLDDVQAQQSPPPFTSSRRPRPPRSCRKQ